MIRKRCHENPEAAFRLFDELITDPYVEVNSFAASILGCVPAAFAGGAITRINSQGIAWERDERLSDFLQRSTNTIISLANQEWQNYLDEALSISAENYHRFGLALLTISLQNENFENIPFFFRHFLLFLPKANLRFQQEYLLIFRELYQRYPTESVHFFEQSLSLVENDAYFRMFRRFLPNLSEPEHSRLRELAKA
ncbi:MAG: hypothetical protein JEZ00_16290 [Anaerolineaceae bacterium]|nr:hypothetical protein [Anaerolineaceae bacterium]